MKWIMKNAIDRNIFKTTDLMNLGFTSEYPSEQIERASMGEIHSLGSRRTWQRLVIFNGYFVIF